MEKLFEKNSISLKKLADHKILLVFLFFALLHRLYYLNYFYVPNSDFFAFKVQAEEWLSLTLPQDYGRLPLYPLLIGIISLILPKSNDAILYSAELTNLLLSIISLFLIYLISSKFLKKFAFLVVFLTAINPLSVFITSQPFLETLLLTTILCSIYLDLRDDNKRFLFALLSSLTRYEGFLLIPIFVIKGLIYSQRKLLAILLGILSSAGMMIWMILSYSDPSYVNPYLQATLAMKRVGTDFIKTIADELVSFTNPPIISNSDGLIFISILIFCILMIMGLYWFLKESLKEIFTVLFFFISYIAMHMVYTYNLTRFVYPVLWIFFLLIAGGIEYLSNVINKQGWFLEGYKNIDKYSFQKSGLIIPAILIFLTSIYFFHILSGIFNIFIYIIYTIIVILFLYSIIREKDLKSLFLICSFGLFLAALTGFSLYETQRIMESNMYNKAEFRFVGEWYSQNAKPGDKMLLTEPWIATYYSGLSYDEYFMGLSGLNCSSTDTGCFITELRNRKITYVVWDSTSAKISRSSTYYNFYKINLISKLGEGRNTDNLKMIKKIEVGSSIAYIYKLRSNNDQ